MDAIRNIENLILNLYYIILTTIDSIPYTIMYGILIIDIKKSIKHLSEKILSFES